MGTVAPVSYFIKDLLTAPKIQNIIKDVNFIHVHLCGTIINIKSTKYTDNIAYIVDDGTACVKCMIPANRHHYLEESDKEIEILKNCSRYYNTVLTDMITITATCTNKLLKRTCKNFEVGDYVKITGKLKYFHNTHTVFADCIEIISDIEERTKYMRLLFYLYDHVYTDMKFTGS